MMMQEFLFSASFALLLVLTFFSITTTSAQLLSPVKAPPVASPPQSQPPPVGLNTVPLVPISPIGSPTPSVPKPPTIDIIQILRKAKRFSILIRLLKTTQLINQLNSQLITSGSGGLTIFAPEDSAFSKLKAGFLNSLGDRQKVELLQFHTLSSFISISNFDTLTNPVQTQAGDDPKRLQLNVTTYGGSHVSMTTGAVNATVTGTVYTDNKLAVYQVDKVLLPLDVVLPKVKAPAPSPGKGVLPKSDRTKSSEDEREDGSKSNDDGGDVVPVDASAASSVRRFKVEIIWSKLPQHVKQCASSSSSSSSSLAPPTIRSSSSSSSPPWSTSPITRHHVNGFGGSFRHNLGGPLTSPSFRHHLSGLAITIKRFNHKGASCYFNSATITTDLDQVTISKALNTKCMISV